MALKLGPRNILHPSDACYAETIQRLLDEVGSDFSDEDDCDENFCNESSHSSDTEISESDNEDTCDSNNRCSQYYYGKNRFKWSSIEPTRNVKTPSHNIVRLPAVRSFAKLPDIADLQSYWSLLFTDEMLQNIITWTNIKIRKMRANFSDQTSKQIADTNLRELKAFLGLLIYTSVFKSNNENIECIFATDGTGRDIFRAVMPMRRFKFLLLCLRFDNPDDRDVRKINDPAAIISEVLNSFILNSQKCYTIGAYACIDEMLVSFRGRCRFKMYMPKKPAKYGLKIMCLTDARTNYVYNAYIYCGKDSDCLGMDDSLKKFTKPTQSILRLSKPIFKSNRNITADNWFSSIEVVSELKKNGLTYVGTVNKNKRDIPKEFLPNKSREVQSTLYGFTKDITLMSHVPKKGKAVVLLSSMHHSKEIDPETQKPEIIALYNRTKGGVDSLDEKCTVYSCSRRTRRWPMAIFYRLLDMSTVNAFILYQSSKDPIMNRMQFLKELAKELVTPHMQSRLETPNIHRELRMIIKRILGCDQENEPQDTSVKCEEKLKKRKTCHLCPSTKNRKTAYLCICCQKPVCLECTRKLCHECGRSFQK